MKKYIWAKDTPFAKKGDEVKLEYQNIPTEYREARTRVQLEKWLTEGWIEKAGRWKPELGEHYHFVVIGNSSFIANEHVYGNRPFDRALYDTGNMFRTKEEVIAATEKVIDLLLSLHE